MKVRIEAQIYFDDEPQPEQTITLRRELRDGESFDEFAERAIKETCRQLHAPTKTWQRC